MKLKWYDQINYEDIQEVMGFAKTTMQNIGWLRDILPQMLAAVSHHWYPYPIGVSTGIINSSQDNTIPFQTEMHHIELTNRTGSDLWINFNNSAYPGVGVGISNGSVYIAEVAFTELHFNPVANNVSYNNPNNANNFALVVGRRIGLR